VEPRSPLIDPPHLRYLVQCFPDEAAGGSEGFASQMSRKTTKRVAVAFWRNDDNNSQLRGAPPAARASIGTPGLFLRKGTSRTSHRQPAQPAQLHGSTDPEGGTAYSDRSRRERAATRFTGHRVVPDRVSSSSSSKSAGRDKLTAVQRQRFGYGLAAYNALLWLPFVVAIAMGAPDWLYGVLLLLVVLGNAVGWPPRGKKTSQR